MVYEDDPDHTKLARIFVSTLHIESNAVYRKIWFLLLDSLEAFRIWLNQIHV